MSHLTIVHPPPEAPQTPSLLALFTCHFHRLVLLELSQSSDPENELSASEESLLQHELQDRRWPEIVDGSYIGTIRDGEPYIELVDVRSVTRLEWEKHADGQWLWPDLSYGGKGVHRE